VLTSAFASRALFSVDRLASITTVKPNSIPSDRILQELSLNIVKLSSGSSDKPTSIPASYFKLVFLKLFDRSPHPTALGRKSDRGFYCERIDLTTQSRLHPRATPRERGDISIR
jgi:hypothetical protein